MAKITFPGLADYELMISRLSKGADDIAGKAIYAGAKIVTDQIRENIQKLMAQDDEAGIYAYVQKNPAPLTRTAKQGLLDGLGIAPLQDDGGYLNVKIGFDGYNSMETKQYPKGQPNALIARSLESGSSAFEKRPFVRPAINATRKQAEAKMAEIIDAEMQKIMDDADKNIKV